MMHHLNKYRHSQKSDQAPLNDMKETLSHCNLLNTHNVVLYYAIKDREDTWVKMQEHEQELGNK